MTGKWVTMENGERVWEEYEDYNSNFVTFRSRPRTYGYYPPRVKLNKVDNGKGQVNEIEIKEDKD